MSNDLQAIRFKRTRIRKVLMGRVGFRDRMNAGNLIRFRFS